MKRKRLQKNLNLHEQHCNAIKGLFCHDLLDWYSRAKRSLPWRASPRPNDYQRAYEVLVSESMLQQTRVETVIEYYKRWMTSFPTLQALSEASEEDVLAQWAGLGYYSRATRLLEAAKYILNKNPKTVEDWRCVPGCGPYTAGAVLSIAWGARVPCIDGNIERILTRTCAIRGEIGKMATKKLIWGLAEELVNEVPDASAGLYNQALMDLGTAVCKPKKPNCDTCPVRPHCAAAAESKTGLPLCTDCDVCPTDVEDFGMERYPRKAAKKAPRQEFMAVIIYKDNEKYCMKKNTERKLLAGLYDFPSYTLSDGAGDTVSNFSLEDTVLHYKGQTNHMFSHIRRTSHVFIATGVKELRDGEQWLTKEDMNKVGISELARKNFSLALAPPRPKENKGRIKTKKLDASQQTVLTMWKKRDSA